MPVYLVTCGWILFDVLICVRTARMTEPFGPWELWTWLISGLLLAGAAVWTERREQKAHAAEVAAQNATLTELRDELREAQAYNRGARETDRAEREREDAQSVAVVRELTLLIQRGEQVRTWIGYGGRELMLAEQWYNAWRRALHDLLAAHDLVDQFAVIDAQVDVNAPAYDDPIEGIIVSHVVLNKTFKGKLDRTRKLMTQLNPRLRGER